MSNPDESTGLISGNSRLKYTRQAHIIYRRQQQVRQFQCCICAILLCIVGVILVFAISYSINNREATNSTNETHGTEILLALTWPLQDKKQNDICVSDFYNLQEAIGIGKEELRKRDKLEEGLPRLQSNEVSFRHRKAFATSPKSKLLARFGYIEEIALKHLQSKSNTTTICNNTNSWLLDLSEDQNKTLTICNFTQKYRTYDGSCNNLKHPLDFGVALIPFRRSLRADYADGISKPRMSKTNKPLPSARKVSTAIHRPIYTSDNKFTVMLAVWGQFIDHDITATAITEGDNSTISCCPNSDHPECFPVVIESDPYYGGLNVTCLDFIRSAPASTNTLGPREQLNQASAYLDGSAIYGNDLNVTNSLRTFQDGKMKMLATPDNRTLLPVSTDANDGCNEEEQNNAGKYCFLTGDQRSNENLHLTSMHLIWARQHNNVASSLKKVNPHWNDETLFQEARHIIAAQIQHITYNEFLPILFGKTLMNTSDILLKTDGYYENYDETIDASIANNFAAATFRFGHTLIPELVSFLNDSDSNLEYVQMRKMLFNPYSLYKEKGLDNSLNSAINTKAHASDTYFNIEVKQHLFQKITQNQTCGLDLVSLNIQRGRDHGLPGYINWRVHCGLNRVTNFKQLDQHMEKETLRRLQQIYENVEDIDLYTGALSEIPLPGRILGPTLTCLLLDQFVRLKRGDRMWYENRLQPHSFTIAQLKEIRLTTLGEIICENSDNLDKVQRLVMEQVRHDNDYEPCEDTIKPNFSKWREHPHVYISKGSVSVKAIKPIV